MYFIIQVPREMSHASSQDTARHQTLDIIRHKILMVKNVRHKLGKLRDNRCIGLTLQSITNIQTDISMRC